MKKIIKAFTISMLGATMYLSSLAAGYTVARHYKTESMKYFFESAEFAELGNNEGYEKCLEQSVIYGKKGAKWEKLTKSVDLLYKLGLHGSK